MRYGISPAEKAEMEAAWKVASNNYQGKDVGIPRIPSMSHEERSEEHEHRSMSKKKIYGKMSTRTKPTW